LESEAAAPAKKGAARRSRPAGLTVWNFYFRVYAGAVKEKQVPDFLQALVRRLRLPLLLVRERLPAHRSRLVQD
jgi:hypothetical protein